MPLLFAARLIVEFPLVLMLADERESAGAIQLLLEDWGYRVMSGGTNDLLWASPEAVRPAVAAIADLVRTDLRTSVDAAIALRNQAGTSFPILVCAREHLGAPDVVSADAVTVYRTPVDPGLIYRWLAIATGVKAAALG